MSDELADSYRWCWRVVRRSGSSFYRSFFLLRHPARDSIAALYAFSRITDDLGDATWIGNDAEQSRVKTKTLGAWQLRLQAAISPVDPNCGKERARKVSSQNPPTDAAQRCAQGSVISPLPKGQAPQVHDSLEPYEPLWPALADSVRRHGIPARLLHDVVRGVMMDLHTMRIAEWDELCDYCYHVASAVGIACTHIWDASDEMPAGAAIDCGIAFQLTNILRDLREDAAQGRIYVPRTLMEQFGCSETAWLSGHPDGDWPGCVDRMVATARAYYARGWLTQEYLNPDGRRMFSLMWRSYKQLLEEIQRRKTMLWSEHRVCLPRTTRWRLAASHFVPGWYRNLPDPLWISRCEP